jgi:hypothetical protein
MDRFEIIPHSYFVVRFIQYMKFLRKAVAGDTSEKSDKGEGLRSLECLPDRVEFWREALRTEPLHPPLSSF